MAPAKTRREKYRQALAGQLPALLETAVAENRDFILTTETDPDTGKKMLYVLSGNFVTPCMLRKLIGQAESQRDEGSTIISRKW